MIYHKENAIGTYKLLQRQLYKLTWHVRWLFIN
jgi:hypothetical protein